MKKTFLTFLPIAAALLLATSCSKDGDDTSIANGTDDVHIVSTTETAPEAPKTVTIPFSVKVDNGTSLSKILYTEKDGSKGKIVSRQFDDGDCGNIRLSITGTGVAADQYLVLKQDGSDFVFNGDITVESTYQESFENGTMSLTGTFTTNGKTDNVGYSTTSLVDLEENHCAHTFKTQAGFTSGSEAITFTDQNAYLSIELPSVETSLYVNGESYTTAEGKVWIVVDPNNKVQSARLSLFNQVVEPGHVYNIRRGAPTFNADAQFSVSATKKVKFSPGNLLYQASSDRWEFAARQWDYVGDADGNNATSGLAENVAYIDFFGWGMWLSGQDPTKSSKTNSDYLSSVTSGEFSGTSAIGSEWATLSTAEWQYLFNTRANAAQLYGHGKIDDVCGMIILPDGWIAPDGISFTPGKSEWSNVFSAEQWTAMEASGAVFLPAAGRRQGTSVKYAGSYGYYWSSSANDNNFARGMYFYSARLSPTNGYRYFGFSVRLVRSL